MPNCDELSSKSESGSCLVNKSSVVQLDNSRSIQPLTGRKALFIVPESVSYFYDVEGTRIAECFSRLGGEVVVCGIDSFPQEYYDWCFLLNLCEIISAQNENSNYVLEQIQRIRLQTTHVALVLMESVRMTWFANNFHFFHLANLDILIDIGFYDQRFHLFAGDASAYSGAESAYRFLFNGLTHRERLIVEQMATPAAERPIPWAFIGHQVEGRIRFLEQLMERVGRDGVVYLPEFTPVTEDGPHMNEKQFFDVLKRTRLKIWCAHVSHYYVESIRFRQAILTGCLPIKVNNQVRDIDANHPFSRFVFEYENFDQRMRELDFEAARKSFQEEYFSQPSFESSLLELIEQY